MPPGICEESRTIDEILRSEKISEHQDDKHKENAKAPNAGAFSYCKKKIDSNYLFFFFFATFFFFTTFFFFAAFFFAIVFHLPSILFFIFSKKLFSITS